MSKSDHRFGRIMPGMDMATATAYLEGLVSYDRTGRVEHPTIERMIRLVAQLGDPQRSYPVIHVTGTNGKGSTTAMTAALLRSEGLRVGTYTSPHLERLGERFSVDGRAADEETVAGAVDAVAQAAIRSGISPSWFEAVTAAGFAILADEGVDVAVVEVGMLGRWDATNVADGQVAVVSNVELDHTDMAGPTRDHIAREKAGIIKPGATLVLGEDDPRLRPIFERSRPSRVLTRGRDLQWSNRRPSATGSTIDVVTPWSTHVEMPIGLFGAHQCDNALLAVAAAEAFLGRSLSAPSAERALLPAALSGRFETVAHDPEVVLDGAHNPAGATALRSVVGERLALRSPRVLVWGMLSGRDPFEFLTALDPAAFDLVLTTEAHVARAVPADILARALLRWEVPVFAFPALDAALRTAVAAAGRSGAVVVTGSLYLVGNALSALHAEGQSVLRQRR